MKKKFIENNSGSAMIWAVLLMMLLSILALGSAFLIQFNNTQSIRSVNLVRSRYVAEAGIELAYGTLTSQSGSSYKMVIQTLNSSSLPRSHSEQVTVNGNVIGQFNATMEMDTSEPGLTWIVITSEGKLNNSNVTVKRIMKVNKDNIKDIRRDEEIN